MCVLKVKVISLPYIFQVLYVLCFTRPRYQVRVYRTIHWSSGFLFCENLILLEIIWQFQPSFLDPLELWNYFFELWPNIAKIAEVNLKCSILK